MKNKYLIKYYLVLKYLPFLLFGNKPKVLSFDENIEQLKKKKSLARFGDGEIRMVLSQNEQIGFQTKNVKLTQRLQEVIKSNTPNLLIGLPDTFGLNLNFNLDSQIFWLGFNTVYAKKITKFIDLPNNVSYGDGQLTRFYMAFKDKTDIGYKIKRFKEIWENQQLLIVEGKDTKLGVGNDLFNNVKSIERIICPSKNAFDKYDEIVSTVVNYAKDRLVLIALGPTATVLAHDLSVLNFWAIDIGHIDIEYMWFKNKYSEKREIEGKAVNEAKTNTEASTIDIADEAYLKSIIVNID